VFNNFKPTGFSKGGGNYKGAFRPPAHPSYGPVQPCVAIRISERQASKSRNSKM